ncbi:MAG: CBS domain-containing protein [Burkholderiales bacterium]
MSPAISTMMQQPVWSIGMDDTIASVEALLARRGLSWVPVLEPAARVVGVISATDLLQFHARKGDAQQVHAWQLCCYSPLVVDPERPVDEVARMMVERDTHHVVVIADGVAVGVVSSLDFVRRFAGLAQPDAGDAPPIDSAHATHVPT